MSDLAEFLLARIAEESELASNVLRLARERGYDYQIIGLVNAEDGWVLAPPARVLAECEAKRLIVALHAPVGDADLRAGLICDTCGSGEPYEYPTLWPCDTVKLIALPYAEHADYREEWKP